MTPESTQLHKLTCIDFASLGFDLGRKLFNCCFPGISVVKNLPANVGDVGFIPGLGKSAGEGNGNPL